MTVEVTQADREAAADFICWQRAATQSAIEGQHDVRQFFVAGFSKAIRQGIWDEHQVVQAFAAHRTTALEGVAGLVEALGPFLFVAKSIPERMHDGRYVEAKIDLLPGELDKLPKIGGETVQSASLNISLDGLNVGHFRALTAAPAVPQDVGGISDRLKRIQRDMLETVSGSTGWIDGSEARAFVRRIEAELQQLAAFSQQPSPVAVGEPSVLRLGEGVSIIETGTYHNEPAVFIEPAPVAGNLGEPSNRATPVDDVLPGGVILVIGEGGPQVLIDALNNITRQPTPSEGADDVARELLADALKAYDPKEPPAPMSEVPTTAAVAAIRAALARAGQGYGRGDADRLCAEIEADAVSALRYIEQNYGRLAGVGWDRVFDAHNRLFAMGAAPLQNGEGS